MKKSEQTQINTLLDKRLSTKKTYKKYVKNESSGLLRRFAAEATRETVRGIESNFKRITKSN